MRVFLTLVCVLLTCGLVLAQEDGFVFYADFDDGHAPPTTLSPNRLAVNGRNRYGVLQTDDARRSGAGT